MHELGVTQRILEVALDRAAKAQAERITAVHLEIGEESDVTSQSVEFYWPQVSEDTPAEGARLVFTVADDPWACRMVAIDVGDGADREELDAVAGQS
jgi:Zn finger protein HypA/HybF involved in hydrogenase expression